uniref:Signal transduction histidine kinase subgroup 3 dimerisation and phosphoacceptor domain-containing protein n=1 Tax=Coralloluteibacterium stylophorae TaxID=1776034 RepID=A0A8J8AY22_9GAMM
MQSIDLYRIVVLLQGAVTLATILLPQGFIAVALLIVVAAQLFVLVPVRAAIAWMLAFNVAVALAMQPHTGGTMRLLLEMLPLVGFQTFAAMTAYYASSAERCRDAADRINAELLATRALLEESARGEERLRLSRELHDVAGHTLTALKLNLRRLARDPACAGHEAVALGTRLADELLDDIRAVVGQLRRHDGIGLRGALEALARQTPGVTVRIAMDDELRADGVGAAEALLRTAQEAITNALRHGGAGTIEIRCTRTAGAIERSWTTVRARRRSVQAMACAACASASRRSTDGSR